MISWKFVITVIVHQLIMYGYGKRIGDNKMVDFVQPIESTIQKGIPYV